MNRWVAGARVRTLPAAVVPVLVGTAVAAAEGTVIWWRAAAAMVTALAIQIGTNYANDYHDGIRGTDDKRVGPVRLVAGGLATPAAVKRAAIISFAVAAVAGLALAATVTWWLLLVGAASFAAGWLYTGGSRPYGYYGYGELFVFLFFGVVATAGSAYVHLERITGLALLASVPVGLLATALLVVNNLRDIPTDAVTGKRTLAVRIGAPGTRVLYVTCIVVPLLVTVALAVSRPWALLGLVAAVFAAGPVRRVLRGEEGRGLVPVLQETGRLQLIYGVLLAIGLAL